MLDRHPLADSEASVADALETLAQKLGRAGVKVARSSDLLPDLADTGRLFIRLLLAALTARWPDATYDALRDAAAKLDPQDDGFTAQQMRGATLTHRGWLIENARRNGVRAQWRDLFRQFDAVIAPVTPTPAFPHDHEPEQSKRKLIVNGEPQAYFANALWAGVATLPGLPATALPIGRSPEGLPIGAQIIGPWLEDRTPLKLAQLIEREFGGFAPPRGLEART